MFVLTWWLGLGEEKGDHLTKEGQIPQDMRSAKNWLENYLSSVENLCWLMISWGIILPFIYWESVHTPIEESGTKPTSISWNEIKRDVILKYIEHISPASTCIRPKPWRPTEGNRAAALATDAEPEALPAARLATRSAGLAKQKWLWVKTL